MNEKEWSNTICLDFDGVIAEYGNEKQGHPVFGAITGMDNLIKAGWWIDVYSGRSVTPEGIESLRDWFRENALPLKTACDNGTISFPDHKPTAKIYVDDRGWHFTGWSSLTPEACEAFRAWWQHPDSTE